MAVKVFLVRCSVFSVILFVFLNDEEKRLSLCGQRRVVSVISRSFLIILECPALQTKAYLNRFEEKCLQLIYVVVKSIQHYTENCLGRHILKSTGYEETTKGQTAYTS